MAIRINNAQLNAILRAGRSMSNLCYNLCQSDQIPAQYRANMKECWEEWDEVYPRKRIAELSSVQPADTK